MSLKVDNIIMDPSNDKFKDECGVFGVYSNREMDVASMTYYGLYALQHRGQESAGIAVANGTEINMHKGMGLITEAFSQESLATLKGNVAIGHVRYSTSGDTRIENAQPLLSQSKLGSIAMAHNGTLVNADVIRELLEEAGHVFHTSIDSEVIPCFLSNSFLSFCNDNNAAPAASLNEVILFPSCTISSAIPS